MIYDHPVIFVLWENLLQKSRIKVKI
jgi:hypothetical protein